MMEFFLERRRCIDAAAAIDGADDDENAVKWTETDDDNDNDEYDNNVD